MKTEQAIRPLTRLKSARARRIFRTSLWAGACIAGGGLIMISCSGVHHTALVVPPAIPGAEFVGMDACADCHEEITRDFKTADHARLMAKGPNAPDLGCEGCHGAGSKHVDSGGEVATIVNPGRSPETCYQCHINLKAQFSMPYAHPVDGVKMTCSDCHDSHKGSSLKGGGTQLTSMNDTCLQCHTQQRGPFVFPHDAVREGCTSCHTPHGSVNQKMLTERNANLCMKCHSQEIGLGIGGSNHGSSSRLGRGTCWSAGCHEGVHGSNIDTHLRE